MKRNKNVISKNYLENIPCHALGLEWEADRNGMVTLKRENKGAFNKIAQIFFKKPKVSNIHLDENGSFVWQCIDGEKDLIAIGKEVEEHFGEASHPLYERLAKYFQVLEFNKFIFWKQ